MNTYLFFGDSVTEAHRNKLCPDDLGQGFCTSVKSDI